MNMFGKFKFENSINFSDILVLPFIHLARVCRRICTPEPFTHVRYQRVKNLQDNYVQLRQRTLEHGIRDPHRKPRCSVCSRYFAQLDLLEDALIELDSNGDQIVCID